MWPLEPQRHLVLVGRQRAELMVPTPAGFSLLRHESFEPDTAPDPQALQTVLGRLFGSGDLRNGRGLMAPGVDVLLETAWLPAVLLNVGAAVLSAPKIQNLLRHRLRQIQGDAGQRNGEWTLLTDYRAGDALTLGYGLPSQTREAVVQTASAAGVKLASLQPAIAWGRRHLRREFNDARAHWWVWSEQDRSLIARTEAGQVQTFNAGGAVVLDAAQCERMLAVESLRQGLLDEPIRATVVQWEQPGIPMASGVERLRWIALREAKERASTVGAPTNTKAIA